MNWKRCGKALKRMLKGDNNLSSKQKQSSNHSGISIKIHDLLLFDIAQ